MEDPRMALTPAEKQKAYRERQKLALETAPDVSRSDLQRPFNEFYAEQDGRHSFVMDLDAVGVEVHGDLANPVQDYRTMWTPDMLDADLKTPIGRATEMARMFLQAARELSQIINAYKLAEIDARLVEIRKRLDKDIRHTFREIRAKGE
jgi:hypothetical protein